MWVVNVLDKDSEILHLVGYEEKPDANSLFFLGAELFTDKEFEYFRDKIYQINIEEHSEIDYNEFIQYMSNVED